MPTAIGIWITCYTYARE